LGGRGGRFRFGKGLPSTLPANAPQFLPSPASPSKEPSSPLKRPFTPSWPGLLKLQSARNAPPSLVRYKAVSVANLLSNLLTPGRRKGQVPGWPWHDTWVRLPPVTPTK